MTRRLSSFALALTVMTVAMSAPAIAGGPRPFRSQVTAQWDNVFAALPPSFGGPGLEASFEGGGPTTHMGKTTQHGTLLLGDLNAFGVFPGTGTVTITGANGDSVTFDFVGFLNPATGEGIGDFDFTSGTGRFANASGSGTFYALIDLTNPTGGQAMSVVLDGQIQY